MRFLNSFIFILVFNSFSPLKFDQIKKDHLKSLLWLIIGAAGGGLASRYFFNKSKDKEILKKNNEMQKKQNEVSAKQKENYQLKEQVVDFGNVKSENGQLQKQKLKFENEIIPLKRNLEQQEKLVNEKVDQYNLLKSKFDETQKNFLDKDKQILEKEKKYQENLASSNANRYLSELYDKAFIEKENQELKIKLSKLENENKMLISNMAEQAQKLNDENKKVLDENIKNSQKIQRLSHQSQVSEPNENEKNQKKIEIPDDRGDQSVQIAMLKQENEQCKSEFDEKIKEVTFKFETENNSLFKIIKIYNKNLQKIVYNINKKIKNFKDTATNNSFYQKQENLDEATSDYNYDNDKEAELDNDDYKNVTYQENTLNHYSKQIDLAMEELNKWVNNTISGNDEKQKKSLLDFFKKDKDEEIQKLKLEIEKLKIENKQLKLKGGIQKIIEENQRLNKRINELNLILQPAQIYKK
jgi:hypothetical protein